MTLNHIINQDQIADGLLQSIKNIYHGYWDLSEEQYPMISNTVFITYNDYRNRAPNETLLDCFRRWDRDFVKGIAIEQGKPKRKWVQQRRPAGMCAMDYEGSRSGRLSNMSVGGHVHALLVLHPDITDIVQRHLDKQALKLGNRLYWKMYEAEKPIRDAIHYSLKGVMSKLGFYQGRNDGYDWIGPNPNIPFIGRPVSKAEAV